MDLERSIEHVGESIKSIPEYAEIEAIRMGPLLTMPFVAMVLSGCLVVIVGQYRWCCRNAIALRVCYAEGPSGCPTSQSSRSYPTQVWKRKRGFSTNASKFAIAALGCIWHCLASSAHKKSGYSVHRWKIPQKCLNSDGVHKVQIHRCTSKVGHFLCDYMETPPEACSEYPELTH